MKTSYRWAALGAVTLIRLVKKIKNDALEIARIHGASAYLKGASVVRDFLLYQIAILACVMFLVFGLIVMEAAALLLLPVQPSTKLAAAFALGAFHCLTGALLLGYFASSKRWLRQALKYNVWAQELMEEENLKAKG